MRFDFESEHTLKITTEQVGGVVVIHMAGQVNDLAADALSKELDEVLGDGHSRIVFDLGDVMFLGSMGLGQIMRAYRSVKDQDGYVRIANAQPLIEDVFRLTKLDKIVGIYPSVEQAVEDE